MTTLDIGWHYSRMEGAAQSQTGGLWHRQDRSPRRHGTRQVDCRRVEVSVQRGPGCGRTLLGLLAVLSAALRSVFAASQNPPHPHHGRTHAVFVFAGFLLLTGGTARAQDPVVADRAVLVTLYNATAGANWTNNTNWLSNEASRNGTGSTRTQPAALRSCISPTMS